MNSLAHCVLLILAGLLPLTALAQTSSLVTIAETGPRADRVNIVMLSEGYTSSELTSGKFDRDASSIAEALLTTEPYKTYRAYFNVYGIRIASAQSGADYGTAGGLRDTYFQASFNTAGIDRYLTVSTEGHFRVINLLNQHVPEHDIVVVVVNDSKYGGAGGSLAITSTNPSAPEIAIHEIAHSFARLTDEYDYAGGTAWDAPNVTTETSLPLLKWRGWVNVGTQVPTPETWDNGNGKVGLFEGAAYRTSGYYRPTLDSKMKTLGQPFYAVNEEAIVLAIYRIIAPIASVAPAMASVNLEQAGVTQEFAVDGPLPSTGLKVDWLVDGVLKMSSASRTYQLSAAELGNGQHTLTAQVTDTTTKVRNDPSKLLQDEYTWTINVTHQAPTAPRDLAAVRGAAGSAVLTWVDASQDESAFIIERSMPDNAFSEIGRVAAGSTSFQDVSLNWGMTATYRVRALASDGSGLLGLPGNEAMLLGQTAPQIIAQPVSREAFIGSTVRFSVSVLSSDPASYQWYKGASVVVGTGAELVLSSVTEADAGDYWCLVSNAFGQTASHSAALTVAKMTGGVEGVPTFDLVENISSVVSGNIDYQVHASGAARYTVRGLPRGMKFDPKTGRLTGRPTAVGYHVIVVTAFGANGFSNSTTLTITVGVLPGTGAYQALVPAADWNGQRGGMMNLIVAGSGSFTGKLRLAGASYAVQGRVVGSETGWTIPAVRLGKTALFWQASAQATGEASFQFSLDGGITEATGTRAMDAMHYGIDERPWLATLGEVGTLSTRLTFYNKWGYRFATGNVVWSGALPDGTVFTGSSKMDHSVTEFPIWCALQRNTVTVSGLSQLTDLDLVTAAGTGRQSGRLTVRTATSETGLQIQGGFAP